MAVINRTNGELTTADLKEDLDRLREDLRLLRADLKNMGVDAAGVARSRARALHDDFDEGVQAAAQKGRDAMEGVAEQVEQHPVATLITTFATGLIAGLLIPRHR